MVQIKHFHKNGLPAWDIKISTIVIGVVVLLVLAFITHEGHRGMDCGDSTEVKAARCWSL